MKNYRKAKAGEITCEECDSHYEGFYAGARIRCSFYNGPSACGPAVGKKQTCDKATKKEIA